MTLTRGEIVAAVDGLPEVFYCEPLRAINKIRNGQNVGAALHPGSDDIQEAMTHGFVQMLC
jgi:hypothetical protein